MVSAKKIVGGASRRNEAGLAEVDAVEPAVN